MRRSRSCRGGTIRFRDLRLAGRPEVEVLHEAVRGRRRAGFRLWPGARQVLPGEARRENPGDPGGDGGRKGPHEPKMNDSWQSLRNTKQAVEAAASSRVLTWPGSMDI